MSRARFKSPSWARRTARYAGSIAFAVIAALAAGQAAAQTVTNGSFNGASSSAPVSGAAISGWTVGPVTGAVCIVVNNSFGGTCNYNALAVPSQAGDLDAGNFFAAESDSGTNMISTSSLISYIKGNQYIITFYQAGVEDQALSQATENWVVTFAGQTINSATMVLTTAAKAANWTSQSLVFIPTTSGSSTLQFLASGTPASGPPLALLDGVRISVPEPGSLMLLALGAAGLAGMRRRRAPAAVAA